MSAMEGNGGSSRSSSSSSSSSQLIIQALPAAIIEPPPVPIIQALPAVSLPAAITTPFLTTNEKRKFTDDEDALPLSAPTAPTEGRRTRSQAVPDWTVHETLVLISEVATLDEDWLRALSSYQRWKMIAENCAAAGVTRSLNHCKRRWETILAEYRSITSWHHSAHRSPSYWTLTPDEKISRSLPLHFDHDVFEAMDAIIRQQDDARRSRSRKASDPQHQLTAYADSGKETCNPGLEDFVNSEIKLLDPDQENLVDATRSEVLLHADEGKKTHAKPGENLCEAQEQLSNFASEKLVNAVKIEEICRRDAEKETCCTSLKDLIEAKDGLTKGDSGDLVDANKDEETRYDIESDSLRKPYAGNGRGACKAMDVAKELEASAEKIHAILRGECTDDADAMMDTTQSNVSERELVRRQADALIRTFGDLAGTLSQYVELIKDADAKTSKAF